MLKISIVPQHVNPTGQDTQTVWRDGLIAINDILTASWVAIKFHLEDIISYDAIISYFLGGSPGLHIDAAALDL